MARKAKEEKEPKDFILQWGQQKVIRLLAQGLGSELGWSVEDIERALKSTYGEVHTGVYDEYGQEATFKKVKK